MVHTIGYKKATYDFFTHALGLIIIATKNKATSKVKTAITGNSGISGVLAGVDVWFGVGELPIELVVASSGRVIVCVGLQSL